MLGDARARGSKMARNVSSTKLARANQTQYSQALWFGKGLQHLLHRSMRTAHLRDSALCPSAAKRCDCRLALIFPPAKAFTKSFLSNLRVCSRGIAAVAAQAAFEGSSRGK